MENVWADLKLVLIELRDDPAQPLQGYPDPRVDRDRHPPFDIHLQPWATEVAGRLHERFGDGVRLTVGALAYPDPTASAMPQRRPIPEASDVVVALAEPLSVPSGHTARVTLLITNLHAEDIAIHTGGQLVGLILDPKTSAVVGGYAGAMRAPLVVFRAAPGETVEVPLLVGTASFAPELGYAIPPGEWAVAADLDLGDGRVARTPMLPLTVLEAAYRSTRCRTIQNKASG